MLGSAEMPLLLSLMLLNPQALEELLYQHGWGRPKQLPALERVAEQLLQRRGDEATVKAQLKLLMEEAGLGDAQVRVFWIPGKLELSLAWVLGRLERRFPPTHYGLGRGREMLLLLLHRGLEWAPLPRRMEPGRISFQGQLRRGYFQPRLILSQPDGEIRKISIQAIDHQIIFELELRRRGIWSFEWVANSQYGPVVLSNHQVYVGVEPPWLPTVKLSRERPAVDPEERLLKRINELRSAQRRSTLKIHGGLERVALSHAQELSHQGRLSHGSPQTGLLSTRMLHAGIRAQSMAENLAKAKSADEALQLFLESPGHAQNLLLKGMTHVGVARVGAYWALVLARQPYYVSPRR